MTCCRRSNLWNIPRILITTDPDENDWVVIILQPDFIISRLPICGVSMRTVLLELVAHCDSTTFSGKDWRGGSRGHGTGLWV